MMSTMPRSRRGGNKKSLFATFLAVSFVLGILLGAVLASTWMLELPALQLAPGEVYTSSITIVGVEKVTGQGRLVTLKVELRAGTGRLLIEVPPLENEDAQKAALDARSAAEQEIWQTLGLRLSQVDIVISIENLQAETIAGPSAGASIAVLIAAAAYAKEGPAKQVRQDAVVSAAINSTGKLQPVGEIAEKYRAVREAGFALFVIAEDQPGCLREYPGTSVERASTLRELIGIILR